jgi:cell division protein FtsB
MVIRRKYRAVLIPLALYCVSGASVAFFSWHAINGERGLKARAEYERRIAGLNGELDTLRAEKAGWQKRAVLMRTDAVDRDLLEEEARHLLGRVNKRDLIIFTDTSPPL